MKKYLMKGVALLGATILIVSCSHDSWNQTNSATQRDAEEYASNFKNVVMGGQNVDSRQTWNTAVTVRLDVSSEIAEGTLKVYTSSPVGKSVAPIYEGTIQKGETKSVTMAVPTDAEQLYVAVYDAENYMRYEVVTVDGSELSVSFNSSSEQEASASRARRAPGSTFINSHSFLSAPDPSIYAESVPEGVAYFGDLKDPWGGHQIYHYTVSTFWIDAASVAETGSMKLQPGYGNQPSTSYIVGTVYAPNDLYLTAGSKLYLTKGSKFVLPGNDCSFGQSDVQIIIAEGAELVCNGKLQFSNTILYNNGTVTTQKLEFAGSGKVFNDAKGTLDISQTLTIANNNCEVVNDGTLKADELQVNGSGHFMNNNKVIITHDAVVNSNNNSWVNNGNFHCNNFLYNGGGSYNVINNCKLICDKEFYIGIGQNQGEFKLDGSIECETFFHGIGLTRMAGKSIIKVAETLTCHADADGCYFGFYGPDSDDNGYAVVQAKKITAYSLTQRRAISYRGCLIVATDDHWEQCDANDGNYPLWDQGDKVKMSLKNKDDITETIVPTECNAGITGKTIIIEEPKQYTYFAFEDLGTSDDFDFNDVVVRVSTPDENNVSTVELCAIGGTLLQKVFCDNIQIGNEVHEYGSFGDNTKNFVKMPLAVLGTVNVPQGQSPADLNINIQVTRSNGEIVTVAGPRSGETPFRVVVSGNDEGKWFWAKERVNISDAYTQFGKWGADMDSNPDWYKSPVKGQVIEW